MKNPPAGWPRISNSVYYDDPRRAIDWLVSAFGFEVRLKVEGDDGSIVHSELTFGDGLIFVGDAAKASCEKWCGARFTAIRWRGEYAADVYLRRRC